MKETKWYHMLQIFIKRMKHFFLSIPKSLQFRKTGLSFVLKLVRKVFSFIWSRRKLIGVLLLIFLVYRMSGNFWTTAPQPMEIFKNDYDLITTKISVGEISDFVKASGKIIPQNEMRIRSRLEASPVLKINVKYGDIVESGQILIQLNTEKFEKELALRENSLKVKTRELLQIEEEIEINKDLFEKGYISKRNYEQSENKYAATSLTVADMQGRINWLKDQITKGKIVSPIRGRVDYVEKNLVENYVVEHNWWVFTVASNGLKLSLSIDGRDVIKVKEGQDVSFKIDFNPDKEFFGTVVKILEPTNLNPHRDKAPVFYEVLATVEGDDTELRSGLSVDATIKIQTKMDIKRIPRTALRFVPPRIVKIKVEPPRNTTTPVIWIANKDNSISALPIETGIRDNEFIEVLQPTTLSEKDNVVVNVHVNVQQRKKSKFTLPQPKRY